jgi:hypothetical protein
MVLSDTSISATSTNSYKFDIATILPRVLFAALMAVIATIIYYASYFLWYVFTPMDWK